MNSVDLETLAEIGRQFQVPGILKEARRLEVGHIHETFAADYDHFGVPVRVIHQRMNTAVFGNPAGLMRNIVRVTEHIRRRLVAQGVEASEIPRRVLQVIPTRDGGTHVVDGRGGYWRTFVRVERVCSHVLATTTGQAYQAGRAFGDFQGLVADLAPHELTLTIPDFHHTPKRLEQLEAAIEADVCRRVQGAASEIAFARERAGLAGRLLEAQANGEVPLRVTHNDTKFNNVLLDDRTGEALCVIDLDTVMPGLAPYDFGDMVRTTTSRAAEDEQDLDRVQVEMPMFEALLRGYLEGTDALLTKGERRRLVLGGKVITYTMGIRFLTDFLSGNHYYRIHREGHNLDRCRTQFRMLSSLEENESAMERLVDGP